MVLVSSVVTAIHEIIPECFEVFSDNGDVVIAGEGFEITIKPQEYAQGISFVLDNMRQPGGWLEFLERVAQVEDEEFQWLH